MSVNAIMIDRARDNVVVVTRPLQKGDRAVYRSGCGLSELPLLEDVPAYHKVACRDIPADGPVVKYGEEIGRASCAIPAGGYVHVHNMASARDPRHGKGDAI